MLRFPNIDPIAVSLGPLDIHWYGIAYLIGIGLGWLYLHSIRDRSHIPWTTDAVGDMVFYAAIGGVLGGRIGYTLFYNFPQTLNDPLSIFAVWQGGMSFHGGVLGFILATAVYARKRRVQFLEVTDFLVRAVPIGLFFGRIANFVNQELWGAPTTAPWGVIFTHPAAGGLPRHPSQLYEAGLEGVALFLILWFLAKKDRPVGVLSAAFLIGYGFFRFLIEFIREPDDHIGYLMGDWLTMGQILSSPMILLGLVLIIIAKRRSNTAQLTGE
jgi:phosphatidylglycerol---prolipoprotein diacylglyceryl transferase